MSKSSRHGHIQFINKLDSGIFTFEFRNDGNGAINPGQGMVIGDSEITHLTIPCKLPGASAAGVNAFSKFMGVCIKESVSSGGEGIGCWAGKLTSINMVPANTITAGDVLRLHRTIPGAFELVTPGDNNKGWGVAIADETVTGDGSLIQGGRALILPWRVS